MDTVQGNYTIMKKILTIEDNPDIRENTAELLELVVRLDEKKLSNLLN
jgi:hypothetical protein